MSEREIAWTPDRQDTLQAAFDGDLHWFNPCGLGGSYICREMFVRVPEGKHPALLVAANALVHAEPIMVGGQGRRRVRITSHGMELLAKWRATPL